MLAECTQYGINKSLYKSADKISFKNNFSHQKRTTFSLGLQLSIKNEEKQNKKRK